MKYLKFLIYFLLVFYCSRSIANNNEQTEEPKNINKNENVSVSVIENESCFKGHLYNCDETCYKSCSMIDLNNVAQESEKAMIYYKLALYWLNLKPIPHRQRFFTNIYLCIDLNNDAIGNCYTLLGSLFAFPNTYNFIGESPNWLSAIERFKKGVIHNNDDSRILLSYAYALGLGTAANIKNSILLLKELEKKGEMKMGALLYSIFLRNGWSTPKDLNLAKEYEKEGLEWYKENSNNPIANDIYQLYIKAGFKLGDGAFIHDHAWEFVFDKNSEYSDEKLKNFLITSENEEELVKFYAYEKIASIFDKSEHIKNRLTEIDEIFEIYGRKDLITLGEKKANNLKKEILNNMRIAGLIEHNNDEILTKNTSNKNKPKNKKDSFWDKTEESINNMGRAIKGLFK